MHTTTSLEPGARRDTTQPTGLVLVSHALCPYVQRVAIVLAEKGIPVERRDIDLANKPAWFLDISPLGKTPVLLVDGEPVFESAVICEYLDDTLPPRLHPEDPLQRARDRAWMEFGSTVLNSIAGFYNAADEAALQGRAREIRGRFEQLEHALAAGPFFRGEAFSVVDAVFGPVFRYFDTFDTIAEFGFMEGLPRVTRWRGALAARASVRDAVHPDYPEWLMAFLQRRPSALAARAVASALCINAGAAPTTRPPPPAPQTTCRPPRTPTKAHPSTAGARASVR